MRSDRTCPGASDDAAADLPGARPAGRDRAPVPHADEEPAVPQRRDVRDVLEVDEMPAMDPHEPPRIQPALELPEGHMDQVRTLGEPDEDVIVLGLQALDLRDGNGHDPAPLPDEEAR